MNAETIFAGFLFGIIGLAAFRFGQKQGRARAMVIGATLLAFPYFVSSVIWMCIIGVALTGALFVWKGD